MRNQVVSSDWQTPEQYIQAARTVMGCIDLDPASSALANETVRAKRFFTEEENGLDKTWNGCVWLNPPFGRINGGGRSRIALFIEKLMSEHAQGHVTQAVALLPVQTNAKWFGPLWDFPICFSRKRVHFNKLIDGKLVKDSRDSHMLGTLFVYLGPREEAFIRTFEQFGPIEKRVDRAVAV